MGWLNRMFNTPAAAGFVMSDAPLKSPWTASSLTRVVLAELTGLKPGEVTRGDAMKIPAIVRGRGLICGTLSRYPMGLWETEPNTRLATPRWLTSTKTGQSPRLRMNWTLDDLIFEGMSVWATLRESDGGAITDALRVPSDAWQVDPKTRALSVYGEEAKADEVLIFESWQDGLLTIAAEAIRASRNLANAWQQRVETPIPLIALKQTDTNEDLDDQEIDDMIADWEAARQAGGTAFLRSGIEAEVMGDVKADLYTEGRNAERLDWGNVLGLPAAMLDGSMSTASLTYSTSDGKRSEFVDYSLSAWSSPIEARLSQDDVCPDGTDHRFDISWLTTTTQPGTNPPMED